MNFFKKMATVVLLISTTVLVASEDYALTEEYKLLNDMKMAKEQQAVIINMSKMLEAKKLDTQKIKILEKEFDTVVHGLIEGDKGLKLNGTMIPQIREQLNRLQEEWGRGMVLIDLALADDTQKGKAIESLNNILINTTQTVALYTKSYNRYKQRSRLSSIVNRHMNSGQKFAFNTIY